MTMRWLITVPVAADMQSIRDTLVALGAEPQDDRGIILDAGELAIRVDGPEDLATRIQELKENPGSEILAAFPDSEMDYY